MTTHVTPHDLLARFISFPGHVQDLPFSSNIDAGYYRTCLLGTTAQRPTTGLYRGMLFYDTTLSKLIVWVGGGGGIVSATANEPGFWTDGTGSSV